MKVSHYNPDLLKWAIDRANTDMVLLHSKFPKLDQWLDKSWLPTLKQLENFAKSVYVPFGYLFLKEPPVETLPISFFRSNKDLKGGYSLGLYQTVQIIKDRQEWLSGYLKEIDVEPLKFVGRFTVESSKPTMVVEDLRKVLGVSLDWFRDVGSTDEVLSYLITKIENAGIMTSISGTVGGNTHRPISRKEFRGFALDRFLCPIHIR